MTGHAQQTAATQATKTGNLHDNPKKEIHLSLGDEMQKLTEISLQVAADGRLVKPSTHDALIVGMKWTADSEAEFELRVPENEKVKLILGCVMMFGIVNFQACPVVSSIWVLPAPWSGSDQIRRDALRVLSGGTTERLDQFLPPSPSRDAKVVLVQTSFGGDLALYCRDLRAYGLAGP